MTNGLYTLKCIRTYSGIFIDVVNMRPEQVAAKDIAYGLARECRFGNHTKKFWSVADHSVWCMKKGEELYPDDTALHFRLLMHDAHEAYLGDLVTPLVDSINTMWPGFVDVINGVKKLVQGHINTRFGIGLCPLECEKVKQIDKMALEWDWENKVMDWKGMQPINIDANAEYWFDYFKKLVKTPVTI